MKRLLCLLTVLFLCLGCFCAYADTSFDPIVTDILNTKISSLSDSGWNSNSKNQGLLTLSIFLDICNDDPSISADQFDICKGACLGYDGIAYYIIIPLNNKTNIITKYIPKLGEASYMISNTSNDMDIITEYMKTERPYVMWSFVKDSDLSNAVFRLDSILSGN